MCYVSINNIQESMERKKQKSIWSAYLCAIHGCSSVIYIAREHNIGNEDKQGISTTAQDVFEQK